MHPERQTRPPPAASVEPYAKYELGIESWLQAIRGEFLETPGLRLTVRDAQHRWPLEASLLTAILEALADVGRLRRLPDDSYVCRRAPAHKDRSSVETP